MIQFPKIIYFVNGPVPSDEQCLDIAEYGQNAVFRNANGVVPGESLEKCDGVVGCIPGPYKNKPTGAQALEAFKNAQKEAREKLIQLRSQKAAEARAAAETPKAQPESQPQPPATVPQWTKNQ